LAFGASTDMVTPGEKKKNVAMASLCWAEFAPLSSRRRLRIGRPFKKESAIVVLCCVVVVDVLGVGGRFKNSPLAEQMKAAPSRDPTFTEGAKHIN
jgi:hypothetical protein